MSEVYKLYTDGSHFPLDKIAGYGGYIEDSKGNIILEFSELINDPNLFMHHEALGMMRGLQLCLERNIKNIDCYSDDQNGMLTYNIKDKEIKEFYFKSPIRKEIKALIEQFESTEFTYIPRELNTKADTLSRKAILKVKNSQPVEKAFVSSILDSSNKYKNKDDFIKLNKTFTDFIIVEATLNPNSLKTHYARKKLDDNTIKTKLLSTRMHDSINMKNTLQAIIEALKNLELKECVICCHGPDSSINQLVNTIKGKIPVSKSLKGTIAEFDKVLQKFDKVTYHTDKKVLDETVNFKPNVERPKLPVEVLLSAMKELGDEEYYIGKNPEIENLLPIKSSHKDDLGEIQKNYFSEFLKLSIKDVIDIKAKMLPEVKKSIVENRIQELRESLTQQGIKLRM